jgi:hypothetical protein
MNYYVSPATMPIKPALLSHPMNFDSPLPLLRGGGSGSGN